MQSYVVWMAAFGAANHHHKMSAQAVCVCHQNVHHRKTTSAQAVFVCHHNVCDHRTALPQVPAAQQFG